MIVFDPTTKRIILDSASVSATEIYSRSADWLALSDNAKYGAVFRQVGGDDLGGGLFIPPYYFLQNTWRIRPMEANHNLTITGNLFVDGGGIPVVSTLGTYQVNVNYTVPVQAQAISVSGTTGPTASEIAAAVRAEIALELARIDIGISTRLATASYVAPANSDITAIKAKTDTLVNTDLTSVDSALSDIKGTGFDTTKHSLIKVKKKVDLAVALSA